VRSAAVLSMIYEKLASRSDRGIGGEVASFPMYNVYNDVYEG